MIERRIEAPTKQSSEIHKLSISARSASLVHRTRFFRRMHRCYSTKWPALVAANGPFQTFDQQSKCCSHSPHCRHSPRAQSYEMVELTLCGTNRPLASNVPTAVFLF